MSNILCAAVSGLSSCTDILVIVSETAVFFSGWNIVCSHSIFIVTLFYNYVYNIPYNLTNPSGSKYRKILGSSTKIRDSSSGFTQT